MTPQQQDIMLLLRRDRIVTHDEIKSVLKHTQALRHDPIKSIRVQINKLRHQGFSIRCVFGVGYELTTAKSKGDTT